MKRFVYRLEKLLEIRAYNERSKSLDLAEVTGRLVKTTDEIQRLGVMRKEVLRTRYNPEERQTGSISLEYTENQISAIKTKIKNLEKQRSIITEEYVKVREIYVAALKEKKVMEKLKEKKQILHVKNEHSRESRVLEDIVMTSFTVKNREAEQWV